MKFHSQSSKLKANEAGGLIEQFKAEGRVISLFDRAVNIRFAPNRLLSVVRDSDQMTAMSVKCPAFFHELKSNNIQLMIGGPVSIEGGCLSLAGLQIDLSSAHGFSGFIDPNIFPLFDAAKVFLIQNILCKTGRREGLLGLLDGNPTENIFAGKGLEIVQRMLNAPASQLYEHLAGFVGLGVGFTPSGDDLICGFLLGLNVYRLSGGRGVHDVDQTGENHIIQASNGTTDGGRALVAMAVQNRFPAFLLAVVQELTTTHTEADISRIVAVTVRYGHTSGTDALAGFLLFYKILNHVNCRKLELAKERIAA